MPRSSYGGMSFISAAFLFHLIGSLQAYPKTIHQPQIALTVFAIWCVPWSCGLCYLIKIKLPETIEKKDWCQVGTIALCHLLLVIISGSSTKCESVCNHVSATLLDVFPSTPPCLEVCSFSYHHLPALQPGSIFNCVLFFWSRNRALLWQGGLKTLSGENNKYRPTFPHTGDVSSCQSAFLSHQSLFHYWIF